MNARIPCVILIVSAAFPLHAQVPKFEVASIKLCRAADSGGVARSGTGSAPAPASVAGRLTINCETLKSLIWYAWDIYATGSRDLSGRAAEHLLPPIEGGPNWIGSDRYRIDAKPEAAATPDTMRGPMLQALLEDRFQLKIHRSGKDVPAYTLTVTKGGAKLLPFQEGKCLDLSTQQPNGKPLCGRPLPHHTGIQGKFDIHLEFGLDDNISPYLSRDCASDCAPLPVTPDPAGPPSIFTALQQQLGLKLEPARAPGETLVIDRVERPSEN